MRDFFYVYLIFDIILIIISLCMGEFWLINTQLAFICSMLIIFASFHGYKNMVMNSKSTLDSEDFEEDDKEIIRETKKQINTFKSSLSPLRLLSYAVLVISFLWLNRQGFFQAMPFLIGLGILPVASLFLGFKKYF